MISYFLGVFQFPCQQMVNKTAPRLVSLCHFFAGVCYQNNKSNTGGSTGGEDPSLNDLRTWQPCVCGGREMSLSSSLSHFPPALQRQRTETVLKWKLRKRAFEFFDCPPVCIVHRYIMFFFKIEHGWTKLLCYKIKLRLTDFDKICSCGGLTLYSSPLVGHFFDSYMAVMYFWALRSWRGSTVYTCSETQAAGLGPVFIACSLISVGRKMNWQASPALRLFFPSLSRASQSFSVGLFFVLILVELFTPSFGG